MATEYEPMVNQWYRHLDKGHEFQVIALDQEKGVVEIQYFDGDVDELDLEAWSQQQLELIEPPEDWTGPVDDVEKDDLGYTETDMAEKDWSKPLKEGGEREEPGWAEERPPESEEEEE